MAIDALGDLDSDDLRIRAMQTIASGADLYIPPKAPNISTQSTLAVSTAAVPPQTRPVLARPANIHYTLINDIHKTSERQADASVKILGEQIKRDQADLERLSAEKQKALQEHAKDVKKRNTWGILGTVAQYITAAATIALGVAFIATGVGTGPGALLIASGGLALFNRVMNDTGAWQAVASWFTKSEELQRKIAQGLDMGFFFLSVGLGLAGGIWAFKAGAFAAAGAADLDTKLKHATAGISIATGAATGAFRVGYAASNRKVMNIQAKMKEIDGEETLDYEEMNENTRQTGKIIRSTEQIGNVLLNTIEGSRVDL